MLGRTLGAVLLQCLALCVCGQSGMCEVSLTILLFRLGRLKRLALVCMDADSVPRASWLICSPPLPRLVESRLFLEEAGCMYTCCLYV